MTQNNNDTAAEASAQEEAPAVGTPENPVVKVHPRRPYGSGSLDNEVARNEDGSIKTTVKKGVHHAVYTDKWVYRIRIDGKRIKRHIRSTSYSDANLQAAAILHEVKAEDPSNPTLTTAFNSWQETIEGDHSPTYILKNQDIFKAVWEPKLGSKRVRDIGFADINAVLAPLRPLLAVSSLRRYLSPLRTALEHCVDEEIIEVNPASKVKLGKQKKTKVKPMRRGDQNVVMATMAKTDPAMAELLWFIGKTGLRRGEACGIKWTDLKLDGAKPYVIVQRNIWQYNKLIGEKDTKTEAGMRIIPLGPNMAIRLKAWRKWCEGRAAALEMYVEENGFAFSRSPACETPIKPNWVTDKVAIISGKLAENGTIERSVNPHMLRHTVATELVASNEHDVVAIAQILGHSRPSIVLDIYAQAVVKEEAMAASLDALGHDV